MTEKSPSAEELIALVDHIAAGIFIHHLGEFRYMNRRAEEVLGYTAEEMRSMSFADFIHPDSLPTVYKHMNARARGEYAPTQYDIQVITKQGETRCVQLTARDIQFAGELCGMATFFDVTELRQREAEHRDRELWANELLTVLFDALIVFEHGVVVQANEPACRTFGYSAEEFIGVKAFDLAAPETIDTVRYHVENDSEEMYEALLMRKDGTKFPAEIRARMIRKGGRKFRVSSARDITERKRVEAEREALQRQIIEAQQARLNELAAPLLVISPHTLLMPLIGTIDTPRVQQIMETLLEGVAKHHAHVAILDITGVKVVDTQTAHTFLQAARAAKLLGARVILTGINPTIAQTLVHLGVNLNDIETYGSLHSAIVQTLRQ